MSNNIITYIGDKWIKINEVGTLINLNNARIVKVKKNVVAGFNVIIDDICIQCTKAEESIEILNTIEKIIRGDCEKTR